MTEHLKNLTEFLSYKNFASGHHRKDFYSKIPFTYASKYLLYEIKQPRQRKTMLNKGGPTYDGLLNAIDYYHEIMQRLGQS